MSNRPFLPLSTRREFIHRLGLGPALLAGAAQAIGETKPARRVRFGLIALLDPRGRVPRTALGLGDARPGPWRVGHQGETHPMGWS